MKTWKSEYEKTLISNSALTVFNTLKKKKALILTQNVKVYVDIRKWSNGLWFTLMDYLYKLA